MSEKKRRDITLGEMQDECSFRGDNCETIGGDKCKFFELCATMQTIDKGCLTPIMWNLTDSPRFTEPQMAFLRAWYSIGARFACVVNQPPWGIRFYRTDSFDAIGSINFAQVPDFANAFNEKTETLDLAEMFGKEEAK